MSVNKQFPFTLPSLGILYGNKIPNGSVELLPMLGEHQEQLASVTEANFRQLFMNVSRQLIKLPSGFDFNDLLMSDWAACFLSIQALSISPEFNLRPKCTNDRCGHVFEKSVNFSEIKCYTAKDFVDSKYEEPFKTRELPFSKNIVSFKLLRLRDITESENYAKQIKRMQQGSTRDQQSTFDLALHILSVNEKNLTRLEAMNWVRQSIAGDLIVLRDEISSWETGYDFILEFDCPKCGEFFRSYLPLDGGGFLGKGQQGRRARKS